jgi:hypothetical protein
LKEVAQGGGGHLLCRDGNSTENREAHNSPLIPNADKHLTNPDQRIVKCRQISLALRRSSMDQPSC